MKKLLLGLGSIAAVAAPIAAVVSCGDKDDEGFKVITMGNKATAISVQTQFGTGAVEANKATVFNGAKILGTWTKKIEGVQNTQKTIKKVGIKLFALHITGTYTTTSKIWNTDADQADSLKTNYGYVAPATTNALLFVNPNGSAEIVYLGSHATGDIHVNTNNNAGATIQIAAAKQN